MPVTTIRLDEFTFPAELPDDNANFRVVFDVKYWEGTGDAAKLKSATSIKPGVDTYWEADRDKRNKPNFRRAGEEPDFIPALAVGRLDGWDREVLNLSASGVHSVRAKVFDVDREDFWDKVKDFAGTLVEAVLGVGKKALGNVVPDPISEPVGGAVDEVSSYLVKKIAGGGDKVLFQGSARPEGNTIRIDGLGKRGRYVLSLALVPESGPTG